MNGHRLNETKIGTAQVIVDILPKGKVIPDVQITPTSITIHQTGNVDASAQANHNYMKNINKSGDRIASWHVTVGYDKIIQAQSFNYKVIRLGCYESLEEAIQVRQQAEIEYFGDYRRQ